MKPTLSKDSETYPLDHNNTTLWIQGVYISAFPGSDTDPPTNEGMEFECVYGYTHDGELIYFAFADLALILDTDESSIPDLLEQHFLTQRKLS